MEGTETAPATSEDPMTEPKPPAPFRRKALVLSCSKCGREISVQAFEDPEYGEGWPKHKCKDHRVTPFDGFKPDARVAALREMPFKD